MLKKGLESLANIFSMDVPALESNLVGWHVMNWRNEAFTRCAYAYETVASMHAKRILNTPLANTIFFAGEALHEGPERGTVEGALLTAERMAELMNMD